MEKRTRNESRQGDLHGPRVRRREQVFGEFYSVGIDLLNRQIMHKIWVLYSD
ncbi:MAG: hypothetical protein GY845_17015 [Planctomycetes bacterium]|nr:hypothetical protein [Planctomycetota bacterium]